MKGISETSPIFVIDMMLRRSENGDTILEVLLSVAVLSLILSTTFALANRSTQANRQAAERGEASRIAQSQMEKLKLYLSVPQASIPPQNTFFCINDTADQYIDLGSGAPIDPNGDVAFTGSAYVNAQLNNRCQEGENNLYYKIIRREGDTYTVYVRWPAVTGNGVDQASFVHRTYPELTSTE